MFACYLDDSGHDQRVVTMAGYVASIDAWKEFEAKAEEFLANYEVPVFHAKEFRSTKGYFEGWTRVKKRSFAIEWYDIAEPLVDMGISISMHRQNYRIQQQELGLNQSMSAYGCCFSSIVVTLSRNPRIAPQIEREGIAFLVESGNTNNNEIQEWFHKVSKFPAFKGALKGLSFVPKEDSRAIQLADFYAFYSRRHAVAVARTQKKLALPIDWFHNLMQERFYHKEFVAMNPYADGGRPAGTFDDFVFPEKSS